MIIDLDPFGFLNISHAANTFTVVRAEAVSVQRTYTGAILSSGKYLNVIVAASG